MVWRWLIDNWSWANGESILRSGTPLLDLDLPLSDFVDAVFRLFVLWASLDEASQAQYERIIKHFRDFETEYETGELVLPGWASLGNVASQYGSDGADPFASPATT